LQSLWFLHIAIMPGHIRQQMSTFWHWHEYCKWKRWRRRLKTMKRTIDGLEVAGYMLCIGVAALIALGLMLAHAAWTIGWSKWQALDFFSTKESDLLVEHAHPGSIAPEPGH
jgi:hypothetical protein